MVPARVALERFSFDSAERRGADGFHLSSGTGIRATVIAFGARLQALELPDRHGRIADTVLASPDIQGHIESKAYFGATCGRYGNRIANGRFELDGETFQVTQNQNGHHLHGGLLGFDRKIWDAAADEAGNAVTFSTVSPDGEEGFPGTLTASVTYRLSDGGLEIVMRASTDRATVVNLMNHTYWNLGGEGQGDVRDHVLQTDAAFYTPTDDAGIPTGEIRTVAGTPFDFRQAKPIGRDLDRVGPSAHAKAGYDQTLCVPGPIGSMRRFAKLVHPSSGRGVELFADAPALQLYSGGHLGPDVLGKSGPYRQFGGVCLEAEAYADAPNVGHFPSARLDPGGLLERRMVFRFFTA